MKSKNESKSKREPISKTEAGMIEGQFLSKFCKENDRDDLRLLPYPPLQSFTKESMDALLRTHNSISQQNNFVRSELLDLGFYDKYLPELPTTLRTPTAIKLQNSQYNIR